MRIIPFLPLENIALIDCFQVTVVSRPRPTTIWNIDVCKIKKFLKKCVYILELQRSNPIKKYTVVNTKYWF